MKVDIGNGKTVFELLPDGNINLTLNDGLTLSITGDVTIESNGNLSFKSTAGGKLTMGNTVATLGAMVKDLFTALQSFHSEGSPAAHTASTWFASSVQPIALKWDQVFD